MTQKTAQLTDQEPWLRGPMPGVHPLVMPVFFSFAMVREDLAKHSAGLSDEQLWRAVGTNSFGFQLHHLAGSVDRITTYLMGEQLTAGQLAFLRTENTPAGRLSDLLENVERSLARSEERLRTVEPDSLYAPRVVGRRALPATVIGLIVHLAEHTQRHLGQAVTIATILKQTP